MICTPASLAQEVGLALGAQAGEARLRDVVTRRASRASAARPRRRSTSCSKRGPDGLSPSAERKRSPSCAYPRVRFPPNNVPGAVARVATDFGDATGDGPLGGEYFSLGAGPDIAPLLHGLGGTTCASPPHWGYVIEGALGVTYNDSKTDETCRGGDLFYWPPGHTMRVNEDAEVILFSPQNEHGEVIDHMLNAMKS